MPEQSDFFAGGNYNGSRLKMYAMNSVGGRLNTRNSEFLQYLISGHTRNIFVKNSLKIHVETGNIYYNDKSMYKSIYDILVMQEDKTKYIKQSVELTSRTMFIFI